MVPTVCTHPSTTLASDSCFSMCRFHCSTFSLIEIVHSYVQINICKTCCTYVGRGHSSARPLFAAKSVAVHLCCTRNQRMMQHFSALGDSAYSCPLRHRANVYVRAINHCAHC